ncbi:MAG: N-acetylmuramoyl-L-alanine amidase [Alistipes sp.]|nr:N-acetylmuramoyl-L-alanine amidase [Alistipes sp.]
MAKEKDEIIIVIDPGHGASQIGAEYNGRQEKNINMTVSAAMAEELEKYEGVRVYLTHTSAKDEMSIRERTEFAKDVDADYFFCIHFNASGNHNFYGAEAWVTSYGRYYAEMKAFSEIVLQEFEEIGVYNRGVKTKLETDGTDYYGVLRRNAEADIPAVIIEHCHMDHDEDTQFIDEEADLINFGKMDATAVAKFLKLKSSELGVDYTNYNVVIGEEPEGKIQNDTTQPECRLEYISYNNEEETAAFRVTARDDEYPILYYGYSVDGGETYSVLQRWEKGKDSMEFTVEYPQYTTDGLKVVVYNAFNVGAETDALVVEEVLEQKEILRQERLEIKDLFYESAVMAQPKTGGELYLMTAGISLLAVIGVLIWYVLDWRKTRKEIKKKLSDPNTTTL